MLKPGRATLGAFQAIRGGGDALPPTDATVESKTGANRRYSSLVTAWLARGPRVLPHKLLHSFLLYFQILANCSLVVRDSPP